MLQTEDLFMILIFILLAVVLLLFSLIYGSSKKTTFTVLLFVIGFGLMLLSSVIYNFQLGLYHQKWFVNSRFLRFCIQSFNAEMSTLNIISLTGEVMILSFFVFLTQFITPKRSIAIYIVFSLLAIFYIYVSLPNTMFKLFISMYSSRAAVSRNANNIYGIIRVAKMITVGIFFSFPFIASVIKYSKTKFLTIRRNISIILSINILTVFFLLIFGKLNYINSFFRVNPNIFFMGTINRVSISEGLMIIAFTGLILMLLVFNSKFQIAYSPKQHLLTSIFGGSKKFDNTIRMIMHTYKNMFLAVRQLSGAALAATPEINPSAKSYISTVQTISSEALYDITHFLEMLGSVDLTLKKVNLNTAVTNAVNKVLYTKTADITTAFNDKTYYIYSDELYMTDMVYTLLENACDAVANRADGKISISVETEDNWLMLDITDNGCGIPKKDIKKIFEPLITYKKGKKNWGIGLYYVNKIVDAHNGHIFVKSKENEYTSFKIFFPITDKAI